VLIDPQYAPKVITKHDEHDVDLMVALISTAAREMHVDLFQRFALMRYWRVTEGLPFSAFLSKDELHMNDWSYGCIAKARPGAPGLFAVLAAQGRTAGFRAGADPEQAAAVGQHREPDAARRAAALGARLLRPTCSRFAPVKAFPLHLSRRKNFSKMD
jgi:hypothetical protein